MVENRLKDFRSKQNLLYSEKVTDETRNACADQFIEEERFGEALEFIEITKDRARLDKVLSEAIARADTFLMARVERIRKEAIPAETWREVAEKAQSLGRIFDAYRAIGRADGEEKAEEFRAEHLPDFQPFKPEGK
jgi:hypothetical protein